MFHPNSKHRSLTIQDNSEVFFKIKRTTPFNKLMSAYCARQGKAQNTLRFLYDGERVSGDETPEDVFLVLNFVANVSWAWKTKIRLT